jgi:hypothetical protein
VTKSLQPDEIMDVLPDYTRDGHRTHEAHDDNALAFHYRESIERWTLK